MYGVNTSLQKTMTLKISYKQALCLSVLIKEIPLFEDMNSICILKIKDQIDNNFKKLSISELLEIEENL